MTQGEPPAPWLAFIGRHQIGPLRQGFAACSSQIRSSTSTPSASVRADKVRAEPVRRPLSICEAGAPVGKNPLSPRPG